jgi:ribose transport system substrate-binding protein
VIDDAGRADAPSAGKSTLIKILSDGKLDATFVYPTGGRQAVDLAAKILAGEKVPHRVVLPTEKVVRPATPAGR